jgi:hypothetical protein
MAQVLAKGSGVYLWDTGGLIESPENRHQHAQHGVADNIWLMCCALHDMLLDIDGLSIGWNNGVPSDRGLDCGDFEESDLPDSIRC